jgi:hypothetical protein
MPYTKRFGRHSRPRAGEDAQRTRSRVMPRCECKGPEVDCPWCERRIEAAETRALWAIDEDSWPDERMYDRWLDKLFGGSE